MPLALFSFSFNPETQEAAFAGNINPRQALAILQNIVIAEGVRKSKNDSEETSKEEVTAKNDGLVANSR